MALGLVISLLAHAGAGAWLVRSASARPPEHRAMPDPPTLPPAPPELGRIDADRASIAWLGVLEDPAEAEAPESEVDQAALSPAPGIEPTPEPQAQPEAQSTEQATEQASVTPVPAIEPDPIPESQPELQPDIQPDAQPQPAPELPVEVSPGPAMIAEPAPNEAAETEPTEVSEFVGPPVPVPTETVQAETQPTEPAPQAPVSDAPAVKPTPETKPGEPAIESPRESDASMRKRAIEHNAELNRPIASRGLEVKTVRPVWPVMVRQSYRPRNPYVAIRFGSDGKVKRVTFIREADDTKGTGVPAVDGPLLDAIYRWTAKGARIDALDKDDPSDQLLVPIRILLTGG